MVVTMRVQRTGIAQWLQFVELLIVCFKWLGEAGLKQPHNIGKQYCPKPTLRVSQLIYKIKNLWKFRLNRSSESGENNGKTHPCFRTFHRVMTCV